MPPIVAVDDLFKRATVDAELARQCADAVLPVGRREAAANLTYGVFVKLGAGVFGAPEHALCGKARHGKAGAVGDADDGIARDPHFAGDLTGVVHVWNAKDAAEAKG